MILAGICGGNPTAILLPDGRVQRALSIGTGTREASRATATGRTRRVLQRLDPSAGNRDVTKHTGLHSTQQRFGSLLASHLDPGEGTKGPQTHDHH